MQRLLSVIVAGTLAGLIGHVPTKGVVSRLWRRYFALPGSEEQIGGRHLHDVVQPYIRLLGMLERMLYAGSWLLGAPEVIPLLLALKAAPSLKEWSDTKVLGRVQFNIWLIGNLISIISSVLVAELTRIGFEVLVQESCP